jgi:beta-lactamase class A
MKSTVKKILLIIALVFCSNAFAKEKLDTTERFKDLELKTEGRLGVFAINTENGDKVAYRANEVFTTGCTSKVIGVSAVLKKISSDPALLLTKVNYSKEDVQLGAWSPITEKNISEGMTIKDLCAAAITVSDNTAMNLLLKYINGVKGMTDFARSIGNTSFRQYNDWPAEALSGGANNLNDSSTPKDMVNSLYTLTLGNDLDRPYRDLLTTWMIDTKTGAKRIRAAMPKNWIVGNKTGTGGAYGTTNDLAIIWIENHKPLLIGVYYTSDNEKAANREEVVCSATKIVIEAFIKGDRKLQS